MQPIYINACLTLYSVAVVTGVSHLTSVTYDPIVDAFRLSEQRQQQKVNKKKVTKWLKLIAAGMSGGGGLVDLFNFKTT